MTTKQANKPAAKIKFMGCKGYELFFMMEIEGKLCGRTFNYVEHADYIENQKFHKNKKADKGRIILANLLELGQRAFDCVQKYKNLLPKDEVAKIESEWENLAVRKLKRRKVK
jgi:hypothetical protein